MIKIKTAAVKTKVLINDVYYIDEFELPFANDTKGILTHIIERNLCYFDSEKIDEILIEVKNHYMQ